MTQLRLTVNCAFIQQHFILLKGVTGFRFLLESLHMGLVVGPPLSGHMLMIIGGCCDEYGWEVLLPHKTYTILGQKISYLYKKNNNINCEFFQRVIFPFRLTDIQFQLCGVQVCISFQGQMYCFSFLHQYVVCTFHCR